MQIVNRFKESASGQEFTIWEHDGKYACTPDRDGMAHEPVHVYLSTFKIAQDIAIEDYWFHRGLDQS